MKILHLSAYDTPGAGMAAIRLHEYLLKQSIDSKILFLRQTKAVPESDSFIAFEDRGSRRPIWRRIKSYAKRELLVRRIKNLPHGMDNFSFPISAFQIEEHPFYEEADIIHMHWVVNLVDIKSFFGVNNKPIIWTFHDMNPYSGGYHSAYGFPIKIYRNLLRKNMVLKHNAYKLQEIHGVCLSDIQFHEVQNSPLGTHFRSLTKINHGISGSRNKGISREKAKIQMGISDDSITFLMIAHSFSRMLKGSSIAVEAINNLKNPNNKPITIIIAGNSTAQFQNSIKNESVKRVIDVGFVSVPELLDVIYRASDLYINPSLAESFSLTTMESLKNGTPVIGFRVGALPEMIKVGKSGIICETGNQDEFQEAIEKAMDTDWDNDWISKDLYHRFNLQDKFKSYVNLYNKVLGIAAHVEE